ncbi:GNAT family N-acetyltransferase [Cohnella yongneupensis]|uniref:GNAT family N-acetyltransferase n=1 Tax=Cohnella yongneupensis TaxID=425006 RepID=A0ABW0R5A0_9BACL
MSANIDIRDMVESDLEAVRSLYVRMYEEQRTFGMVMELNVEEVGDLLSAQLKSKLYLSKVAAAGEEIVGFGFGSLVRSPKKYRLLNPEMPFIGFIHDVYFVPERRGSGLAVRMVAELEREFAEQDIDYVELHVLGGNARGLRFWEASGYQDLLHVMYKRI